MKVEKQSFILLMVVIKSLISVWKAVLHLYMIDDTLPLPTIEEIIVCTETTTIEEVSIVKLV